MKKTLAICLLLLLVVGCGKSEQASESPAQRPQAPTLADSFQGKRIHFQIEKPESDHTQEFWLQVGNTNQLTAGSGQLTMGEGDEGLTTAFARKSNTIFLSLLPSVVELRFAKAELAVGDPVTVVEHTGERTDDFQARVDSATDSTAFGIVKGSIVKIEAAQEIEAITFEAWSQESDTDPSESIQSSKSANAKIQLQALGKALDLYQIDMNSYPASVIGLRALMERPTGLDLSMIWGGPYLKRDIPPDPWGNAYLYKEGLNDFELQVYKIWSAGPNKKNENGEEGTDDIVVSSEHYEEVDVPWVTAGIIKPQTEPADTEKIQPNNKVIGIVLENKARAYLLDAFDSVERTVLNDVIEGTPVTITYYPMEAVTKEPEKRVRVFVDKHGNKALVMGLAGVKKGKMVIYCQKQRYPQMGSKIPVWHDANQDGKQGKGEVHYLADLEFEVMNWGDWKKAHPDTDVYLGRGITAETPLGL